MKISKTSDGWIVIPQTKSESDHLAFIFDALKERYGRSVQIKEPDVPAMIAALKAREDEIMELQHAINNRAS